MFQPPVNITINDLWIPGLILASIVWIESLIVIWLSIKIYRVYTNKTKTKKAIPTKTPMTRILACANQLCNHMQTEPTESWLDFVLSVIYTIRNIAQSTVI